MNISVTRSELEHFRSAIVERTGLYFDDARLSFLEEVLRRGLTRRACSSASYLDQLENRVWGGEIAALAEELTVNETYFFRHYDQFRALAEIALPDRMRARATTRTLRIMSAGCASGEEAYSAAIVTRELAPDAAWSVAIDAVDLNRLALQKVEKARYSAWALREAPPSIKEKWFRADGRDFILDERVRGAVRFREANLASDDPELWLPDAYDVIFCRNVLMYFAPEQMRATVARTAKSLAPGGYLFLGHAETLRGVSDDFELCHTHDAFYYRRKNRACPIARTRANDGTLDAPSISPSPQAPAPTDWISAIAQASERVARLTRADRQTPPLQPSNGWQLAPALDLLRSERFSEALDHIGNGPPESWNDTDVLLVKAVLLVQSGQPTGAAETCRQLLSIDGLNAGAHYVLALCHEHAGDRERAMEHDRFAAHLDPAFAMPRLHCGLLARHIGDRDTARRELAQALLLLKREDVSRLLLFGGGFSRDALIVLCQSAVAECGGRT